MTPRFLYFDLGKVVLNFSHHQACQQIAEIAGVTAEKVWHVLFETGLEWQYEAGQLDDQQFYEAFCESIGTKLDYQALLRAGNEIFWVNTPIVPVLVQLQAAGYRMGLLSNTCPAHWNYCSSGRYSLIRSIFSVYALSYEIGACKPAPKIFQRATELAGVTPEDIFFTDDITSHVSAACEAGWDAVQFTSTATLAMELSQRGIRFNY